MYTSTTKKPMTMQRNIYLITILLACIAPASLLGQQDAMHAQNIMNHLRINPAYAGYQETPTVSVFHRSQWVGFKGAPSTQTLTFDMPVKRAKFALGGSIGRDKIGPINTMNFMLDAAARVQVTRKGFMSFGLKASGSLFQANLTEVALTSSQQGVTDDLFSQNARSVFMPNIGFGFFYSDPEHFVSLSIPRLLNNSMRSKNSELYIYDMGVLQPVSYLMAGKIWKINKTYKIQPTLMARGTMNAPLSVGINTNLIIMDALKVGVYYYYKEVSGAMIQYEVDKKLKIGYSVDFATNRLINTNFGSHELMVSYMLKEKRRRIVYPRYF